MQYGTQVNMVKFEEALEKMRVMGESSDRCDMMEYSALMVEALTYGTPEFAEFVKNDLSRGLTLPPVKFVSEDGFSVYSLEELAAHFNTTVEQLEATHNRLSKVRPDLYLTDGGPPLPYFRIQ